MKKKDHDGAAGLFGRKQHHPDDFHGAVLADQHKQDAQEETRLT